MSIDKTKYRQLALGEVLRAGDVYIDPLTALESTVRAGERVGGPDSLPYYRPIRPSPTHGYRWADKGEEAKEYRFWSGAFNERGSTCQTDGRERADAPNSEADGVGAVMPWPEDPRLVEAIRAVSLGGACSYKMDGIKVLSETYFCRVCRGEPIAPWPGEPGKGPTHHTCYPGEELQTLKAAAGAPETSGTQGEQKMSDETAPSPQPFKAGDLVEWTLSADKGPGPGPHWVTWISYSDWSGQWYVELGANEKWYAIDFRLAQAPVATAVPKEVHERGWQWRPVDKDTAFAPPFGTIRKCQGCGSLSAGGPTVCGICAETRAAKEAKDAAVRAEERRMRYRVLNDEETIEAGDEYQSGIRPSIWYPCRSTVGRKCEMVDLTVRRLVNVKQRHLIKVVDLQAKIAELQAELDKLKDEG